MASPIMSLLQRQKQNTPQIAPPPDFIKKNPVENFARQQLSTYAQERIERRQLANDAPPAIGIDMSGLPDDTQAFLKRLGQIESSSNYNLGPNKYGYEGMYQHRYRPGDDGYKYMQQLGVTVDQIRQNPALQDKIMVMALADYDKQLRGAGIPVNNFTRWLRHNQGLQGTKWLLNNQMTPTLRRNISTNLPKGMEPTIGNYMAYWRKKWGA